MYYILCSGCQSWNSLVLGILAFTVLDMCVHFIWVETAAFN